MPFRNGMTHHDASRATPRDPPPARCYQPGHEAHGRVAGHPVGSEAVVRGAFLRLKKSSADLSAGVGPLVGRVRELRDLHDAFEDATRGRGGVELVLGEPGIGKTRLARALAEHAAERGARVIWTRAQGIGAPAYRPWVEVVRGLTDDLDGETLRDELGAAADELLRLVPRLAARLPAARRPARDDDSRAARFELFDALVALLRVRSARAPVVVLIDDLHAVDEGSLVALDFV